MLTEEIQKYIPENLQRIIDSTLEDIIPTIWQSPKETDNLKTQLKQSIENAILLYSIACSQNKGPIDIKNLAQHFKEAAREYTQGDNQQIALYLENLAEDLEFIAE